MGSLYELSVVIMETVDERRHEGLIIVIMIRCRPEKYCAIQQS